jgi:hypothetical protein
MIRIKIIVILSVLLVVAIAAIGFMLGRPGKSEGGIVKPKQEVSIHTTVRSVLPAAEFISLHYRYTSVIQDVSSKEMFGFSLPGTEKKMLAVIDGTIKLGIDCKSIKIDTTRSDTLFIKFPPIKILSHELHPETAQVYDQKNGLFNKYKATDHFALEAKQKSATELNVRGNMEIITQARQATESAFKSFLGMIPAMNTVPVVFKWY